MTWLLQRHGKGTTLHVGGVQGGGLLNGGLMAGGLASWGCG